MNRPVQRTTRAAGAVLAAALMTAGHPVQAADAAAGPFRLTMPPSFAPLSGAALDQLRRAMQGGARDLASRSGLADPGAASTLGSAFFAAYRTADARVTVAFQGTPTDQPADIEEMLSAGRERVNWGVETGQLRRGSAVSRQEVGGHPCLLQNIHHARGGHLRTWLCVLPEAPKLQLSMAIVCETQADCERRRPQLDAMLASLRFVPGR